VSAFALRRAGEGDWLVLERLLQLYLYEFTDHTGQEIGPDGRYAYRYFAAYRDEPGRHAFLFEFEGLPAGFAFVREVGGGHEMAEFFVLRKHRRQGLGRLAAKELFARFAGPWEVREFASNTRAQAFWRVVIAESVGHFEEADEDGELVQRFVSRQVESRKAQGERFAQR
jgi:predicted acetyltransferase